MKTEFDAHSALLARLDMRNAGWAVGAHALAPMARAPRIPTRRSGWLARLVSFLTFAR